MGGGRGRSPGSVERAEKGHWASPPSVPSLVSLWLVFRALLHESENAPHPRGPSSADVQPAILAPRDPSTWHLCAGQKSHNCMWALHLPRIVILSLQMYPL